MEDYQVLALEQMLDAERKKTRLNEALIWCLETIIESGQDTRLNYLRGPGDAGFQEVGLILNGGKK